MTVEPESERPDEPPFTLSKDSERAVMVVFDACQVAGASLVTCHRVAAMVAEELERVETRRAETDAAP
jgi:hypothetical protein